jgi:hypothetical protein
LFGAFPDSFSLLRGMKESYSICFTSHGEVMFRDEEDHGMFVNVMAIEGFRTESEILSDAEMSNHVHFNAFTRVPMLFAARTRMAYTKYFNRKYGRKGRMGEKGTYVLKVDGFNHQLVLSNYILRNGLHHCAAATAFGYPFSSVHEPFAADLGWPQAPAVFTQRTEIAGFLPRFADFPDSYQMDGNGVILRRCFMEIRRVEQYYATPRNFLFQMNRLTDESWKEDQLKDRTGKPLTLADLEPGLDEKGIAQLLNNEYGRNFSRTRLQDLDVCRLIDRELLPSYGVPSVYYLSDSQKNRIARTLLNEFHLPEKQIRRCLVI